MLIQLVQVELSVIVGLLMNSEVTGGHSNMVPVIQASSLRFLWYSHNGWHYKTCRDYRQGEGEFQNGMWYFMVKPQSLIWIFISQTLIEYLSVLELSMSMCSWILPAQKATGCLKQHTEPPVYHRAVYWVLSYTPKDCDHSLHNHCMRLTYS